MDIAAWLRGLGLEQYALAFHDNAVDGEVLRELTADDLKDLGVTLVGHRRKLLARSMHEGKHSSVTLIGCSRFGCNRQQPAWEIVVAAAGLSGRDWVGAGG